MVRLPRRSTGRLSVGLMAVKVAVIFNFIINYYVHIKYFGQKHEHVDETPLELSDEYP